MQLQIEHVSFAVQLPYAAGQLASAEDAEVLNEVFHDRLEKCVARLVRINRPRKEIEMYIESFQLNPMRGKVVSETDMQRRARLILEAGL